MSKRALWVTGIVAVACLCSASATADEPRPRTVSVSGMAEVSAEPDIARVTLGVESRKPTMEAARTEVAKVILSGKLSRKVLLKGVKASKGAVSAIEAAGGKVEAPAEKPAAKPARKGGKEKLAFEMSWTASASEGFEIG